MTFLQPVLELEPQQLLILSLWLFLAGAILLFVQGARARIVVFFDWRDLVWTLSPPIVLSLGLVASRSLLPAPADPDGTTALANVVLGVGKGGAALGVLVSLGYAIRYNGLMLGPVVFAFKLVSLVMAVLLAILLWPAKGKANPILLPVVIVGCLVLLINGQRVLRRRALTREERLAAASARSTLALELRTHGRY